MDRACARAARTGQRIYLYGGRNHGALAELARALRLRHPGLQIVGGHCPPFRPLTDAEEAPSRTTSTAPAPTSSGSGSACPKQEKWMARMRDRLDAPVLVGVGAAFDFHAGLVPQAPDALQRLGLEWVVPARAGAAPAVAALPALQPALRARLRAPVRAAARRSAPWRG